MPTLSSLRQLTNATTQKRAWAEALALWQLTWPILIAQLATVGMSVAEVAMAGHVSAQDLAGVSLGTSIWIMVIITLIGITLAVNPVVSHHVGAKNFGAIAPVVRQALWKAFGVGLVAVVVANLASLVFEHLSLEPQVRDLSRDFVRITSLALPAFALYRVLYGYSASLNQTKPLMVTALLTLALNVLVNWVLVFGKLGFAPMGGLGCAWATVVCVWFNLGALLWWMQRAPAYHATWPFDRFEGPNWPQIRSLLALGLPIGVTYFAEVSAFSLIALMVARFGTTEVAAHQIALNFSSLVFMVPLSLGMALLTRVSQALGAGDPVAARFRAWVGVAISVAFAVVSAIGMAVFNEAIAAAYTRDLAVAALAAQLLFVAAIFQLSDSLQVAASSAIRGYKVTRAPMVIHLMAFWVVSLPLGFALGVAPEGWPGVPDEPWGAKGFWVALVIGLTIAAASLVLLLRRVARQHLPR